VNFVETLFLNSILTKNWGFLYSPVVIPLFFIIKILLQTKERLSSMTEPKNYENILLILSINSRKKSATCCRKFLSPTASSIRCWIS
jgi:hypothetical protein